MHYGSVTLLFFWFEYVLGFWACRPWPFFQGINSCQQVELHKPVSGSPTIIYQLPCQVISSSFTHRAILVILMVY